MVWALALGRISVRRPASAKACTGMALEPGLSLPTSYLIVGQPNPSGVRRCCQAAAVLNPSSLCYRLGAGLGFSLWLDPLLIAVGIIALLLPLLASADLWTPSAPLPLNGAQAIVWLEGPLGRSLSMNMLRNCYVADPRQLPVAVVCLD